MPNFTVNISCDNASFTPDPAPEITRILQNITLRIQRDGLSGFYETIFDLDGNDVGRFALKP